MVRRLLSASVLLSLVLPSLASARIWPDDFMAPSDLPSASSSSSMPMMPETTDVPSSWFLDEPEVMVPATPTVIGDGMISRADFVAALVSRSVTQNDLDSCFANLSIGEFSLLFRDVSVSHPRAKELCIALKSGLVRGYSNGTFRPDDNMNTAEASVILVKLMGIPANPVKFGETWYDSTVRRAAASVEGIPANGRLGLNGTTMRTILCSLASGVEILTAEEGLCTK